MAIGNEAVGVVLAYPARFKQHDGEILVTFRDIGHAITSGHSEADALEQARDCLAEAVACMLVEGEPIPAPSRPRRGERVVPLDPIVAAKAMLSDAMRVRNMTQTELARRLDIGTRAARRLLDPHHASQMDALIRALSRVGVLAAFTLVNAAENRRLLRATSAASEGGVLFRPMKALRGRPAKALG